VKGICGKRSRALASQQGKCAKSSTTSVAHESRTRNEKLDGFEFFYLGVSRFLRELKLECIRLESSRLKLALKHKNYKL
jgi:hypothetical protein